MFQDVYNNPEAKKEEEKAIKMLEELYEYYIEYPTTMSPEYQQLIQERCTTGAGQYVIIFPE